MHFSLLLIMCVSVYKTKWTVWIDCELQTDLEPWRKEGRWREDLGIAAGCIAPSRPGPIIRSPDPIWGWTFCHIIHSANFLCFKSCNIHMNPPCLVYPVDRICHSDSFLAFDFPSLIFHSLTTVAIFSSHLLPLLFFFLLFSFIAVWMWSRPAIKSHLKASFPSPCASCVCVLCPSTPPHSEEAQRHPCLPRSSAWTQPPVPAVMPSS